MKWSADHNYIGGGTKRPAWATVRRIGPGQTAEAFAPATVFQGGKLSVNINQMQANASGGQSAANVPQKLVNAFHSRLGRMGELIVPALVGFGAPPKPGCGPTAAIWIFFFSFFCLDLSLGLNGHTVRASVHGSGRHRFAPENSCLLGTLGNLRPSCPSLSSRLSPLPRHPSPFAPAVSVTCSQASGHYIAMT